MEILVSLGDYMILNIKKILREIKKKRNFSINYKLELILIKTYFQAFNYWQEGRVERGTGAKHLKLITDNRFPLNSRRSKINAKFVQLFVVRRKCPTSGTLCT